jgi:uncharacterized protein YqgV (UPF0045/DUF77 family)
MTITAEISLYPLVADYESVIINFIKSLRLDSSLKVTTHAMSTYVRGENKKVFDVISNALESANKEVETLSLIIKVINRDLPVEKKLEFLN